MKSHLISLRDQIWTLIARNTWLKDLLFGRKTKWALLLSGLVIIWFIWFSRLYQPQVEHLERLKKRIDKVSANMEAMKKQLPDVSAEQKMLEERDRDVEALRVQVRTEETHIPDRSALSELIQQFSGADVGSLVMLKSVKPAEKEQSKKRSEKGETAEPQFYEQEGFLIELFAGYWNLVRYLYRLEQTCLYFSFPNLSVQLPKKDAAVPEVQLHIGTLLTRRVHSADVGGAFISDFPPFEDREEEVDPFGLANAQMAKPELIGAFKVSGVIWRGGNRVAIVNGTVVREGDTVDKARVVTIEDTRIILEKDRQLLEIVVS